MAKSTKTRVRHNTGNIAQDKFVAAYMESFTAGEGVKGVATRLNIAEGSVTTRASNMRKDGIELPKFPVGGGNKRDKTALNEQIQAALKAAEDAKAAVETATA
jgi:transposase